MFLKSTKWSIKACGTLILMISGKSVLIDSHQEDFLIIRYNYLTDFTCFTL